MKEIQNNLSIIRGETKIWKFLRRDADGNVITATPTAMFFSMKKTYEDTSYVLRKSLSDGITHKDTSNYWFLQLNAADTLALEPGAYVCDLKVLTTASETYILPPQTIIVRPNVTDDI